MTATCVVIDKDNAVAVLVVVHSHSALAVAICTPKQGPHACSMIKVWQTLQQLGYHEYIHHSWWWGAGIAVLLVVHQGVHGCACPCEGVARALGRPGTTTACSPRRSVAFCTM